jgi:ornithine cyclodeaminase/alanine dehydrogenase-like protein (mu-crystallin family)
MRDASRKVLFLDGAEVKRLLSPEVCFAAVEHAFRLLGEGKAPPPAILAMRAEKGSFHVKAGMLSTDRPYFAAKINANFPGNASRGLPTIQGAVILSDAADGTPLAIMDSGSITALRTAAASALASKHLARKDWRTLALCGCGGQAEAQLLALYAAGRPERVLVYDLQRDRAAAFADAVNRSTGMTLKVARTVEECFAYGDVVVTCTTAKRYFVTREMVRPGTFVAAVGADNEEKQEIDPALLAAAKVVTDVTAQAAVIGDLHHAIAAGVMSPTDVHAELAQIVCGRKPGRESDDEITVFDSTGTGLQDVAAAIAAYRAAIKEKIT